MKQIINSFTYPEFPNIEVCFEKKIDFFFDSLVGFNKNKDTFKIMYLNEVVGINELKNFVINNNNLFDIIITHHPDILKKCKNSYLLPRGTTWVFDFEFRKKIFCVSNLAGEKTNTDGHILRQKIHYKQNKIKIPKDFYIGRFGGVELFKENKILKGKKHPLYNSQFNIAIENIKQNNWFTEKLIDCFVTKTIPIYYGCPNIEKWFDIRGMFVVNNVNDIINVCNSLNENTYNEKLEFVERNFELCQEFKTINDRLERILINILK